MSIIVDEGTKLLVQGITGRDGSFHTKQMLAYGTNVVAGVTPGKGGETVEGVPVFDNCREAVESTGANTSVLFVPAPFAPDAIFEAKEAGIKTIVCITEGIPTLDMSKLYWWLRFDSVTLIGPNSPGVISPGKSKVGILPSSIFKKGTVGVVSRSGTLTYEIVYNLTLAGFGQSTCIGIGGDQIIGTSFVDVLEMFARDDGTEAVVLIGEIGGTDEQDAAEYIKREFKKPVVAFIAGQTAPPGRRMGHAGAIISGSEGTAREKIEVLKSAGVPVAPIPSRIPELLKETVENH
ncbi:succinate--CoA ligase subunit alpha [bacterium]|nr:succinate--CoA ligase subunit alpha [bacterium]